MSGIAIDLLTHASRLPINIISKDVVLQEAAVSITSWGAHVALVSTVPDAAGQQGLSNATPTTRHP